MPRARLPQLHSIADGSFEPKRKNAITLREDENLEDSFKPLQIGGKNTALELSSDSLRVSGNLLADRIEGDVNINNGNLNIDAGFKLRFDSESELAGYFTGNSSIHVEDDVMHFTVGGVTLLKLTERVGLGTADDDQITTFGSHISLDEGFKLYFEGMDSDSYLTRTTSDVFEFYGDNVKLLSIKDDGNVVVEAGKLILENGEYISNGTDSALIFSTQADSEMARIDTNGIDLPTAKYLVFDGSGGHTHIRESADDVLTFTVGNIHIFEMREFSSAAYAGVNTGNKIVFDMDTTLTTYITESSNDILDIYVGGDKMLSLDESVDSGVTSLVGTLKIAEQADASADTDGYGQLWVDTQTPNCLAFTDDAGTDIIGICKYHYETKFIGFYAGQTAQYLPMTGYVFEKTSTASQNEFIAFVAPYNCTIEKFIYRSEAGQDGTFSLRILESSDATEIPSSMVYRKDLVVDIDDDTYLEYDLTSPSVGSDYSPLTKGRIYSIYLATPATGYDTNITLVFKWDVTS